MNEAICKLRFKNLLKNWETYVFHWEKCSFEHIGNNVHTVEFWLLALGKTLDIYLDYLMFYPRRQHMK